jgi:hypothetical protein
MKQQRCFERKVKSRDESESVATVHNPQLKLMPYPQLPSLAGLSMANPSALTAFIHRSSQESQYTDSCQNRGNLNGFSSIVLMISQASRHFRSWGGLTVLGATVASQDVVGEFLTFSGERRGEHFERKRVPSLNLRPHLSHDFVWNVSDNQALRSLYAVIAKSLWSVT